MAVREGIISAARAARLDQGERLIQELRRRLIAQLLEGPEDRDLKAALAEIIEDVD